MGGKEKTASGGDIQPMEADKLKQLELRATERLAAALRDAGGGNVLPPGWRVQARQRMSGSSRGDIDYVFFGPGGRRYRSQKEAVGVMLQGGPGSPARTGPPAEANGKAQPQQGKRTVEKREAAKQHTLIGTAAKRKVSKLKDGGSRGGSAPGSKRRKGPDGKAAEGATPAPSSSEDTERERFMQWHQQLQQQQAAESSRSYSYGTMSALGDDSDLDELTGDSADSRGKQRAAPAAPAPAPAPVPPGRLLAGDVLDGTSLDVPIDGRGVQEPHAQAGPSDPGEEAKEEREQGGANSDEPAHSGADVSGDSTALGQTEPAENALDVRCQPSGDAPTDGALHVKVESMELHGDGPVVKNVGHNEGLCATSGQQTGEIKEGVQEEDQAGADEGTGGEEVGEERMLDVEIGEAEGEADGTRGEAVEGPEAEEEDGKEQGAAGLATAGTAGATAGAAAPTLPPGPEEEAVALMLAKGLATVSRKAQTRNRRQATKLLAEAVPHLSTMMTIVSGLQQSGIGGFAFDDFTTSVRRIKGALRLLQQ